MSCVQEEQLPAPKAGMRQQLDLWASQVAAIKAGGLQLSCELDGLQSLQTLQHLSASEAYSPRADWVAAPHPAIGEKGVVLVPITGRWQDLASQQLAQPPSHTLIPPGPTPSISEQLWTPTGQHLVLVSSEGAGFYPSGVRVSTFCGTQLVGSFAEPLADGEEYASLCISDDAASMLLTVSAGNGDRVMVSTAQGVTARHAVAPTSWSVTPLQDGQFLRASLAGDRLFICSAACVQEISLQRAPAADLTSVQVDSWGGQASVLLLTPASRTLLFVDLVQKRVQLVVQLPHEAGRPCNYISAVHGARAVAVRPPEGPLPTLVLATSGTAMGRELFRCLGGEAVWDPLGRFLAVAKRRSVRVLDGTMGAVLATWPAHGQPYDLRWLPDSSGLVLDVFMRESGSVSWCVLRFGSAVRPGE